MSSMPSSLAFNQLSPRFSDSTRVTWMISGNLGLPAILKLPQPRRRLSGRRLMRGLRPRVRRLRRPELEQEPLRLLLELHGARGVRRFHDRSVQRIDPTDAGLLPTRQLAVPVLLVLVLDDEIDLVRHDALVTVAVPPAGVEALDRPGLRLLGEESPPDDRTVGARSRALVLDSKCERDERRLVLVVALAPDGGTHAACF